MSDNRITRRDFVADTSKLAFGAMILPRSVLGGYGYKPPSATLNIAIIGAGGMGMNNMKQLLDENIVAICDVDMALVERKMVAEMRVREGASETPAQAKLKAAYEKAAKYTDYRVMLERQRDIDAVLIATPDHLHAVMGIAAMKAGKHVYIQKPLAYSVHECRALARVAKETGVVTQMGNQGHSMEGTRRINEWVQAGIIGPVREAHVFTNRPVNYWAQGIPRPVQQLAAPGAPPAVPPLWNMRAVENALLKSMADGPHVPPSGMDWDLWLGPSKEIPYHSAYHPFTWRGWVDFGGGALGDMGAHLVDQPYWALGLTQPVSVVASSSPWGGPRDNPATFPLATTAQFQFAARGSQPPVKMFWYDSGILPPRPDHLPDDVVGLPNGDGGGGYFVGDKGVLTYETYGRNPRIYPESLMQEAELVPKSFARVETGHETNWALACKGETTASSPFEYAAGLTECMLLGVAALRAGQGKKLIYDATGMRFTNAPEADQYLTREYRSGWSV